MTDDCIRLTYRIETAGDVGGVLDAGEDATMTVQLRNDGVNGATAISATLSSSTPGVTITQASSAYPDLAVGASDPFPTSHFSSHIVPSGTLRRTRTTLSDSGFRFTKFFSFSSEAIFGSFGLERRRQIVGLTRVTSRRRGAIRGISPRGWGSIRQV